MSSKLTPPFRIVGCCLGEHLGRWVACGVCNSDGDPTGRQSLQDLCDWCNSTHAENAAIKAANAGLEAKLARISVLVGCWTGPGVIEIQAIARLSTPAPVDAEKVKMLRALAVIHEMAEEYCTKLGGCPAACGQCVACDFAAIVGVASPFVPPPAPPKDKWRAVAELFREANVGVLNPDAWRNAVAAYDRLVAEGAK